MSCIIGKETWHTGNDEQYKCCCGKMVWFDKYEYKRLTEEYGYDKQVCCGESCKEKEMTRQVRARQALKVIDVKGVVSED